MRNRPLYHNLMKNDAYFGQYHAYFHQLLSEYWESGHGEAVLRRTQAMIAPYVEADPTAFCSYADHLLAADTLLEVCLLRAESIRADGGALSHHPGPAGGRPGVGVDASAIDLRALGYFDDLEVAKERQDATLATME